MRTFRVVPLPNFSWATRVVLSSSTKLSLRQKQKVKELWSVEANLNQVCLKL